MNGSEPNDHIEGVDLLFYRRTKPLHGHIVTDCYYPVNFDNGSFNLVKVDPKVSGFHGRTSTPPPEKVPCLIESVPQSRVPVALPFKPEKNHPTKGGTREESEPLFSEFARCDSIESIINFADKYGRLTDKRVGLPDEADPMNFCTIPGEPIKLWQDEVNLVKLAQAFWLADPEFTRERIVFESDANGRAVYYYVYVDEELLKGYGLADSNGIGSRHLEFLPEGDYTAAAKYIAATMVNKALYYRHRAYSTITAKGVGEFELRIVPRTLISLIWHSLAEVIAGQRTIRRCIVCGQLIEVHDVTSTMIFHKDCSNRTRMRRSRYKDIYTGQIAAGTPLPEVAKACKVNLQVLEYWLSLDNKQGGDKE